VTWHIHVPHYHRGTSLVDVAALASELDGEDRTTSRALALYAVTDLGMKNVGELLDFLAAAGPAGCRRLLNHVRKAAGLVDIKTVEARREYERANAAGVARASVDSGWQLCHADGCNEAPMNEVGCPIATEVRRWFCPNHRDQAVPGDLEPRGSGIKISECGTLIPADPDEEARAGEAAESRRRQLEDQAAAREHEAAEIRDGERRQAAAFESLLPWNQARQ
jgi:hypothetical protein